MAEDWLADVRRYVSDADETIVAGIVRYCGIALRTRDASLVSFSDKKETDRVRENFLKKKLALTFDDATLDAAIAGVGERMKADRTKNRVTVYYLLAEHFGMLELFRKPARASKSDAAPEAASAPPASPVAPLAAVGAAGAAAAAAVSPAPTASSGTLADGDRAAPAAAMAAPAAPAAAASRPSGGLAYTKAPPDDDGLVSFGCLALAVVLGGLLLAMVLGGQLLPWADQFGTRVPDAPAAPSAPTGPVATAQPAAAPAPVTAPAAPPAGAGVVASERDGKPMVTTYFDVGKSEVSPDFAAAAEPVLAYLRANPGARVAISGFNDPSGNAAANAELAKNRAQAVQAALVALGVDQARTDLVKPENTTTTDMTPEEARRVELTIVE